MLVWIPLQEMFPLVIDRLVGLLTTIQSSKSLQKVPISNLVILQIGPGVDIVGGRPEAGPLVAVSLPVLPGVPVPEVEAVRKPLYLKLCHLCQEYLSTCSLIRANLSAGMTGSRRASRTAEPFLGK